MATIKGKWKWNDRISEYLLADIAVNFTSKVIDGVTFSQIKASRDNLRAPMIYYIDSNNNQYTSYYGAWMFVEAKYIDFGTIEQNITDEFYTWFTSNATPYTEVEGAPTTIIYNGNTLVELKGEQTAVFPKGVKAITDVSVVFGEQGSITHGKTATGIKAGETAKLLCGGKIFGENVVVNVFGSAITDNYNHSAPELHHHGIIPEGGEYYDVSESRIYSAGDPFPRSASHTDRYIYGDYVYNAYSNKYPLGTYWAAKVDADRTGHSTDRNQKTYKPILESIAGAAVLDMDRAFYMCTKMQVPPAIPINVRYLNGAYMYCMELITPPIIPAFVEIMTDTFAVCSNLAGSITINATPTSYTNCLQLTQVTEILGSCGNKEAILATK